MEILDYELLRMIWWVLLGVLLIGFAATDGFDMGTCALLPFIAKDDMERRVVINTIGAVWEGNQVWLLLGGGAIFAAWPTLYAVSFSGFYLAMALIVFALIIRPVAFKFRSKQDCPKWRSRWDWCLFIGGFIPALIMGVAVGNQLQGVPFEFNKLMMISYEGNLFGLLNPFGLLCGLLSVAMLVMHGAAWLTMKTDGAISERARKYGMISALSVIGLFVAAGFIVANYIDGYVVTTAQDPVGPSNPTLKTVELEAGAWMNNYAAHPWMWIAPILAVVGAALAAVGMKANKEALTFLSSKLSVVGIISTVGLSMFPVILPSSLNPNHSLTVFDSSSSHGTLGVMLIVVCLFLPIILLYTAWVYKVLWGKVRKEDIEANSAELY